LSETVHSAVRSGFIISGLTTVVEELIYNSLDAGATKVNVLHLLPSKRSHITALCSLIQ